MQTDAINNQPPSPRKRTPPSGAKPIALSAAEAQRFWDRVDRGEPGACWPWTGPRHPRGYGTFSFGKLNAIAHRVAWTLVNGPIPPGMLACHHCDNPPCVNPDHIFLGTDADNSRDRDAKGRNRGVAVMIALKKIQAASGRCKYGHSKAAGRVCVTCDRAANRRKYLRRKARLAPTPVARDCYLQRLAELATPPAPVTP